MADDGVGFVLVANMISTLSLSLLAVWVWVFTTYFPNTPFLLERDPSPRSRGSTDDADVHAALA
jgi:hypothetical protein